MGKCISEESLVAFTSGVLSSECAVVWFVGLSLLPSVSAVTHGKRDFDAQSLLVALYDVLGPPRFQRSPGIPSLQVSQTS